MNQLQQIITATSLLLFFCVLGWIILGFHEANYLPQNLLKALKLSRDTHESFSNYTDCIAQGYNKEFCSQNPTLHSTDICQCPAGLIGRRMPGFGGKCVCTSELDLNFSKNNSSDKICLFKKDLQQLLSSNQTTGFSSHMINNYH